MKRISASYALVVLALSILSCGSPAPQEQGFPPSAEMTVTITRGLVSLDVQNTPVSAVLAELGRQAQLSVNVPDQMQSDRLTLGFRSLPLEEALKRVLAGQPHAVLYAHRAGQEVVAGVRLWAKEQPTPTTDRLGAQALALLQASQGLPIPSTRGAWGRGSENSKSSGATPVMISDELPLDELQRALTESQDPARRAATLEAIANRGEEGSVTPIVAQALWDADAGVRNTALSLLRSSFDPVPIGPLASMAMLDPNPESRLDAMTLMTEQLYTEERTKEDWAMAKATLGTRLSDPDPDVRDQASMLLPDLAQGAQLTSKWGSHR